MNDYTPSRIERVMTEHPVLAALAWGAVAVAGWMWWRHAGPGPADGTAAVVLGAFFHALGHWLSLLLGMILRSLPVMVMGSGVLGFMAVMARGLRSLLRHM